MIYLQLLHILALHKERIGVKISIFELLLNALLELPTSFYKFNFMNLFDFYLHAEIILLHVLC